MADERSDDAPAFTDLSKPQRRVLGVLLEKAFTTPEYYPLTLKAVTTGCNQKSNRDPVTSYSEEEVADTLDELRKLGLAAVVHTESGRTERYRHYMRKQFSFTEPQLAILTELLLRGRQQLGELRTRASRMVPIESQEQLRDELNGLLQLKYVQASGPLQRRGVEVDHAWYRPNEGRTLEYEEKEPEDAPPHRSAAPRAESGSAELQSTLEQLQHAHQELRDEVAAMKQELTEIQAAMIDLRRELGG